MLGMVMAEFAQVGLMILSKAAMTHGMSSLIFIFYSNALASLLLLPSFAQIRASSSHFLYSLLVILAWPSWIFGYAGIYYSSPTLATAMLNLVQGLTFILAVGFRFPWGSSSISGSLDSQDITTSDPSMHMQLFEFGQNQQARQVEFPWGKNKALVPSFKAALAYLHVSLSDAD
ncbi:putative Auxin-induced protein 5NG4 [Corchorus olitorius]|uniref:Auxin-induced protein 5NG4 n=1 Tax=Corchorus olitorius TaxID=93759 RepID=A0A1R3I8W1_9ROSI|nr:putative Auxin-induced protein 5NG4 [Corchorus olitorius]